MKKFAKIALILMCAVALVACSILGTLAYLKAESNVATNTFTVGKVAITLDEAKVDLYGVKDSNNRTTEGNEYKLIAGHTYVKDPTVTVAAGSEESYVRMIVTITDIDDLKVACGIPANEQFMPGVFVGGWDASKWECVDGYRIDAVPADGENPAVPAKGVYIFNYTATVDTLDGKPEVLDDLFETFTLPTGATNAQIEALDDLQIDVQAFAIQADGFTNADAAWDAFPADN